MRILMVDDHPTQLEGYKIILAYNNQRIAIESVMAYNCKTAFEIIKDATQSFDMFFLDLNLPGYPEEQIKSGEDLAYLVKERHPNSKIIMLTSHSESFLLYNIVRRIEPNAFLVKSDFGGEELLDAFDAVLNGQTYHSETVRESIHELLSREEYLDSYNRQIITLLAQGVKTKNLPERLNLSMSAVEKRKSQIKDYFCIEKGNDEDIVREARKLGFV
jgi:two-component system response regulator NreC